MGWTAKIVCIISLVIIIFVSACAATECPECNQNICPELDCNECESEGPISVCPELDCNDCSEGKEEFKDDLKEVLNEDCPICKDTIKYVCADGRVVLDQLECFNAPIDLVPVTTNENGTNYVGEVRVKSACIKGIKGGEIYFKVLSVPKKIVFEVKKNGESDFKSVYESAGLFNNYNHFAICDSCKVDANFKLEENTAYLFRIRFVYTTGDQVSNEHLIDTRAGEAFDKYCGG